MSDGEISNNFREKLQQDFDKLETKLKDNNSVLVLGLLLVGLAAAAAG